MAWQTRPAINEIIQVGGYLHLEPSNPLDETDETTWGTKLGYTKDGALLEPGYQTLGFQVEETGEEIRKVIYTGSAPIFIVILRNYNENVLAQCFPGLTSGTKINFPGGLRAGDVISTSTYSKHILFVPDDIVNHPAVLFQRACPSNPSSGKILLSHVNEALFACYFTAIRADSINPESVYQVDFLKNLVIR